MGPFLWPSAGMPSPLVEDSKAKGYKGKLWEFFVKVLFLLGDSDREVRKQEASTERECWVWAGFLTILLHHWLEGSGSKNEVTCFKIPTSQRLPLVRTRPQKKTGYLIKFFVFSVGKVSLANTSKYLRNLWDSEGLLLFSWEERALSRLGSSACGEVCLGPDSSGLVYSPARHGFGKSFMGEQTIQGPICA